MRYKVTEGPLQRAQRVLIYGPEGIGKSTMASNMPNPVFIDIEDGTGHLYVRRMPNPPNWDVLIDECRSVSEDPEDVSTVVIDSIDAAERLCQIAVCKTSKKPSIEAWGYGKGYVIAAEEFQKLLDALDDCIAAGVNVVLVAHSQMRKFERPDESGAYDRFEVKLNKHVASKVKEWADAVLFLDYETFVSIDESGKGHASGGKRVIRTSHSVSWDAKNRWGLQDKLVLDDGGTMAVREHLPVRDKDEKPKSTHPNPELLSDMSKMAKADKEKKSSQKKKPTKKAPNAPKRLQPLFELCQVSGIKPHEVKAVMVSKGKRDKNQSIVDWEAPFIDWLAKQWPKVEELVIEARASGKLSDAQTDVYDESIPF